MGTSAFNGLFLGRDLHPQINFECEMKTHEFDKKWLLVVVVVVVVVVIVAKAQANKIFFVAICVAGFLV